MFGTSKYSFSGRLVHAVLLYSLPASIVRKYQTHPAINRTVYTDV